MAKTILGLAFVTFIPFSVARGCVQGQCTSGSGLLQQTFGRGRVSEMAEVSSDLHADAIEDSVTTASTKRDKLNVSEDAFEADLFSPPAKNLNVAKIMNDEGVEGNIVEDVIGNTTVILAEALVTPYRIKVVTPYRIEIGTTTTTTPCIFGKVVRINGTSAGSHFNIMEIQVNGQVNPGMGLTARLSSGGYKAGYCVDGDVKTMCSTNDGKKKWWAMFTLPSSQCINRIEIWNRQSGFQEKDARIVNATIKITEPMIVDGVMKHYRRWESKFYRYQPKYNFFPRR